MTLTKIIQVPNSPWYNLAIWMANHPLFCIILMAGLVAAGYFLAKWRLGKINQRIANLHERDVVRRAVKEFFESAATGQGIEDTARRETIVDILQGSTAMRQAVETALPGFANSQLSGVLGDLQDRIAQSAEVAKTGINVKSQEATEAIQRLSSDHEEAMKLILHEVKQLHDDFPRSVDFQLQKAHERLLAYSGQLQEKLDGATSAEIKTAQTKLDEAVEEALKTMAEQEGKRVAAFNGRLQEYQNQLDALRSEITRLANLINGNSKKTGDTGQGLSENTVDTGEA